jgi:hypothetical protein
MKSENTMVAIIIITMFCLFFSAIYFDIKNRQSVANATTNEELEAACQNFTVQRAPLQCLTGLNGY